MTISTDQSKRLRRLALDLLLGSFLLGLFLVVWMPPGGASSSPEPASPPSRAAANLLPFQGTSVIATINGSISTTDSTFTGQRHLRTGVRGDINCAHFGENGARFYDEYFFSNTSSFTERVGIVFTSACATNTYMVAYSPRFNPNDICDGYIASAGISGNVNWSFNVCGGTQFSIVVYGLEPGTTCSGYSFSVSGTSSIEFNGPFTKEPSVVALSAKTTTEPFAISDVKVKKRKNKHQHKHHKSRPARSSIILADGVIPPPGVVIPIGGTSLIATITDSIDFTEPSFRGPTLFPRGIISDPNCVTSTPVGTRFYDEYFFSNSSSITQRVTINFQSFCGFNTYMAAYNRQFNPNNICENLIAAAGVTGNVTWGFTVCPQTVFSIIVYNISPGTGCSRYSYSVFANGVNFEGRLADLSMMKTGPPGPIPAGSNLTYLLTATNNGPNPADNVIIRDVLPNGTTFVSLNLLTDLGTTLAAPICTTPPVGSPGTVTCSMNLLPSPGTNMVNSIMFALTVNVTPTAGGTVSNTATVMHSGPELNPSNNSSTVSTAVTGGFTFCLQDESNGNILRIISSTGDYVFINCRKGTTLTGRGTIRIQGCKVDFLDTGPDPKRPDRSVIASINTCARTGSASVRVPSSTQTLTIQDQDISNNTCACQ